MTIMTTVSEFCRFGFLGAMLASLGMSSPALADNAEVEAFYKGNTIRIIVPGTVGPTADTYSRMLAPHLSKLIPGNPNVVVENKPGGASILGTSLVYNTEPKDGTVIGTFIESVILQHAIGLGTDHPFDLKKFNWLGSGLQNIGACGFRTSTGISSFDDLLTRDKEVIFGTIGPGSVGYSAGVILRDIVGAKLKFVSGYQGTAPLVLNTENGELEGFCAPLSSYFTAAAHLLEGPDPIVKLVVVFGNGSSENPLAAGLPNLADYAKTERDKVIMRILAESQGIGGSMWMAPGVPEDRLNAVREAFAAALSDPEVQEEAKRRDLPLKPTSWQTTTDIVGRLLEPPADALDTLILMYKP